MIFNKSALNVSTRGFKTLSYTLEYFIHKYKDIKPIKQVGKSSVVDVTFHNYIISRYIYEPRGEALGRLAQSTSFNYNNVFNVNVQKKAHILKSITQVKFIFKGGELQLHPQVKSITHVK